MCFWKLLLLRSIKLFSDSESEVVQSLSKFRVFAVDKCKEQKKTEHKQLYRFLPQIGSSPVLLALPRRVPLKCNVKLQVAQNTIRNITDFVFHNTKQNRLCFSRYLRILR